MGQGLLIPDLPTRTYQQRWVRPKRQSTTGVFYCLDLPDLPAYLFQDFPKPMQSLLYPLFY